MEPLTAGVIVTLAFTKAFETTIEKFTEAALVKMDELRQKIWNKLRGNPRAEKALTAVEQGNKSELERLAVYLQDVMDDEPQFASQVQALAQEINVGKLLDNSNMTQNNYDNSTGYQTKVETEKGTTNIGGHHTHNYHT
ncbi:hypothetical protein ACN23B_30240 (plasmid) [Anabaena sp. FACHB-709]|uniref:Uncharacterized protein n=1 Tax=Trichormus variabilis NIES-23 TaxID=1973479 RepID=A0A1Z4KWD5_ANAVA|nr:MULTISPECIES: hypothetical protein [Nostocaceae]BAY73238.1 hypothetical protein NIES23_60660 [Trichormus variabilis NIES-23]HBW30745.1 hypothetical protein [Nostoc sp. UBA8866]MBD2266203.1 hypothetical protein [Anabaena sp. FACHB-709]MBD2275934.1 hypothetical protein [Nostoc sp. PCC 7120 = FACHB-418]MBD2284395.1 hypothetical protein [Anabaena cylindrica FACHB-170]